MFASILKDCPDYRALTAQEQALSEMIEDLFLHVGFGKLGLCMKFKLIDG